VKEFMGKEYLVLKVKYEEDSWYFFILTYAMEVYQFYHDETKTMENTSYLVNKKFTVESKYQNQNLVRKGRGHGQTDENFCVKDLTALLRLHHIGRRRTFISDYNRNKCGFMILNNKYTSQ
jgi:hypothetical protein